MAVGQQQPPKPYQRGVFPSIVVHDLIYSATSSGRGEAPYWDKFAERYSVNAYKCVAQPLPNPAFYDSHYHYTQLSVPRT